MTMDSVNIATLKAKLSHYIRTVRAGRHVQILDRNTPVARLIPHSDQNDALPSQPASQHLQDVKLPTRANKNLNSLQALLEERSDQ